MHSIGADIVSDDKCCRMLAWLNVYGVNDEVVIVNPRLNAVLRDLETSTTIAKTNCEWLPFF
ncbi:hypothetical protein FACS1894170_12350 [Planctomycetales bacterium]|nr:hypothetical protein FACS1894170_12350 [Planctomycetales bacterium]